MHATHTGLHRVKRKKNHLSIRLTQIRKLIDTVAATPSASGFIDRETMAGMQCEEAVVRREVRALHLADCYMRGRQYSQCEDPVNRRTPPDWARIEEIIEQHGGPINRINMPAVSDWSSL